MREGSEMGVVEASGKTVEEAIEHALAEMGVERDAVEVEVVTESKSGILGVGGTQAVVRVRLIGETDAPAEGEDGELIEDEAEIAAQMLDHLLELMGVAADVSIRLPRAASIQKNAAAAAKAIGRNSRNCGA